MKLPHLDGYRPIEVDIVFHECVCSECNGAIPQGSMIGLAQSPERKALWFTLCKACVHKELARREVWLRTEYLPAAAQNRADYLAGKADDE